MWTKSYGVTIPRRKPLKFRSTFTWYSPPSFNRLTMVSGGGGGVLDKILLGEAPPQGPTLFYVPFFTENVTLPIPFNCCKCIVFYLNMNKSQNLTCSANVFLGGRKLLVYVFFISVAAISSLFWSFNVALTRTKTFAHPKKTPALQAT